MFQNFVHSFECLSAVKADSPIQTSSQSRKQVRQTLPVVGSPCSDTERALGCCGGYVIAASSKLPGGCKFSFAMKNTKVALGTPLTTDLPINLKATLTKKSNLQPAQPMSSSISEEDEKFANFLRSQLPQHTASEALKEKIKNIALRK